MPLENLTEYIQKKWREYTQEAEHAQAHQEHAKRFAQTHQSEDYKLRLRLEELEENVSGLAAADNPSIPDAGGTGTFTGSSEPEIVWNYFISQGYTKEVTAGIMGNMQQESGISSKALQNGGEGPGTGLIQWENAQYGGSGRWNTLEGWAGRQGIDPWDIQTQLRYLTEVEFADSWYQSELAKYLKQYGYQPGSNPVAAFKKVGKLEHGVYIFELVWERAGHKAYENRIRYAKDIYQQFKDYASPKTAGTFALPAEADNYLTSGYGRRLHPTRGEMHMHPGLDIAGGGLALTAIADGQVTIASDIGGGYGNLVKIDHGNGFVSLYAHLAAYAVRGGQKVVKGQRIGTMGTTGLSTGVHLHFELHKNGSPINPELYFPNYPRTAEAIADRQKGLDSVL